MYQYDMVVIGGGPAGMAAAISAKNHGVEKVLLLEREDYLGGALNQCIHSRFGKDVLHAEVTGPEYAQYFIDQLHDLNIEYKLNTMVLNLSNSKILSYVNPDDGMKDIETRCVVLATGSREKYTGNINIPTNKFAGIYTVGTAHKFVNMQGYLPGKEIVIFGSSDISLIVARRLVVEGAKVKAIVESSSKLVARMDYSKRIAEEFDIPIILSHTVHEVIGKERIEKVILGKIEENGEIDEANLQTIECDALLLSVGWLPESKLAENAKVKMSISTSGPQVDKEFSTSQRGIFACGNLIHAYSLADKCTYEGEAVGLNAAEYIKSLRNSQL